MRHLYNNWMNEAIKDYTPSGRIKRPSYSLVASWVKESWDSIDSDMIRRSFKCCGISNNLDGKEDNLIFNFNKVEKVNNQRRGIEEDEGNDASESEDDSNGNESDGENNENEDNYYKENEDCNVVQNWN